MSNKDRFIWAATGAGAISTFYILENAIENPYAAIGAGVLGACAVFGGGHALADKKTDDRGNLVSYVAGTVTLAVGLGVAEWRDIDSAPLKTITIDVSEGMPLQTAPIGMVGDEPFFALD